MAIALPDVITNYFDADKSRNADAVSACFTATAVVKDEGQTYSGRDTIRRWKADSSQKYSYTAEPFAITAEGDQTVVTSHLTGDFPGSPVDLRYLFVLDNEKIAQLEIVP
ncbi:nuclear transport factor 2 family protein [Sphingobium sp. BYY-5]|uniref:nuclear transport factor 2 family protein n=1 Tax=Sphingobium sp. BYY-5 TaxID=2926400 RepID=UPI001FA6B05F|nr:nuclear transport factor 2 family protein [Sphingobium sp. BYY-5]MCI4592534.1 nuclear transport factor 2 family protein [Sphingobium sp. BYY-5]